MPKIKVTAWQIAENNKQRLSSCFAGNVQLMRSSTNSTTSYNCTQIKYNRYAYIISGLHKTVQAVLLVIAYLLSINIVVAAPDAVSLAVGKGNNTINVAKTGARKHFTHYWFDTNTGRLTGYWELSLGYWHETQDHIFTLGLSPVFVYEFRPMASGHQFYINGGIGVALISETQIGERDLASAFQFEDQIGLGLRFGTKRQHDMNFGFLHYSNAKIQPPNDGIDIWLFTYTHWLESHR